ncbi:hypothetical protein ASD99_02515 [Mesorhizobium sp. Root695]|uniref:hypothetical protein n=2 Tax=unclassified Mesorhizobium TaxID=325217 RepID=UPI0006F2D950|nr:hypothetical protein [Mesorhizobium sp. Root102]KQU87463.1 hypothetical protein ASD12_08000 [Mesorhizobium sp. Root102]KRB34495.1 hypothetical protein ASD99_02515 [Mesorhizobium sp. Root695]
MPLDMLAEQILSEAPRIWLHNPKISAAQLKLADMERKRVERIDAEARKLLVAAAEIASGDREIGPWEEGAVAHGLKSVVAADGVAIGFLVREQEWKSFVAFQFGLAAKNGFTRKDAFAAVKAEGWIDKRFGFVGEDVADSMRRVTGRGVRVPWEAIGGRCHVI